MNYGLYLSASGVLTNMYRQDVFANNLANVNTPGFKPDLPTVRQRDPESVEDNLFGQRHDLLDRLGGGALAGRQWINFSPGSLLQTGGPLDAALVEKNQFFVVAQRDEKSGETLIRLTRDGRLGMNADGELIQMVSGARVLDENDQPIHLNTERPARIDRAGRLIQDGEPVGKVQIARVEDPQTLTKLGQNLLGFADGQDTRAQDGEATIRPGYQEASGVEPVQTLMSLVDATKAITANANLIRYHDMLMDKAVNVLGRVTA
ncbi:MAG: flagellar hook basal-body protein [Phycisphaeraceae bacterium]|nr:flagellar hook basal-body protein [Phycisphaeraceae bacterium]